MIYVYIGCLLLDILLAIYHIRKAVKIAEWNTLSIVFWIFCTIMEVLKINKFLGGSCASV